MRTPKRRWSDPAKRTEAVVRMREAGWPFRKIAADLGVSVGTVHRDLSLWAERQADLMVSAVQSGVQSGPARDAQSNAGLNGERP
jgi:IS30 family transposase